MKSSSWSEDEIEKLRALFPNHCREEVQKALSGRSWNAIVHKAYLLGIPRYVRFYSREERKLSDFEAGYLSGLIDGEGYIGIYKSTTKRGKPSFHLHVVVTNTNPDLIKEIRRIVGDVGQTYIRIDKKPQQKPSYVYRIPLGILRQILPYLKLVAKKKQLEIIKKLLSRSNRPYTKQNAQEWEEARLKLHELNKRGRATTTKRL